MKSTQILTAAFLGILPFFASAQSLTLDWGVGNYQTNINGGSTGSTNCVTTDAEGNVYTTGYFDNTMDLDPGPDVFNVVSSSSVDIFIQKLDSNGNFVWGTSFGGGSFDWGNTILADAEQNVYIGGHYNGWTDFDPGPGVEEHATNGNNDAFVLKLNADGEFDWVLTYGSSGIDDVTRMVFDLAGNICVMGMIGGNMTITTGSGTGNLNTAGNWDAYILKLEPDGDLIWSRNIGGANDDMPGGLNVDADGNILATGYFRGAADFNEGIESDSLVSNGSDDVFVLKLNPMGDFIWVRGFGGDSYDRGCAIQSDAAGNVFVVGSYYETVDFDPGLNTLEYTSNGIADVFVQKYTSSGEMVWTRVFGGPGEEYGYTAFTDAVGSLYVGGSFVETVDFDPGPGLSEQTSQGGFDVYYEKYDTDGNLLWLQTLGGSNSDYCQHIVRNAEGKLLGCGHYLSANFDVDPSAAETILPVDNFLQSVNVYVVQFEEELCANMALVYDSVQTTVTCEGLETPYAAVHPLYGAVPFTYTWSTGETTPVGHFPAGGIYTVNVTDAYGCEETSSILINGPSELTDFDLDGHLIAGTFRPGFPANAWVDVLNSGCEWVNGELTLVIDSLLTLDSASITPDAINGDTLIWNLVDMAYDSAHVTPHLYFTVSPDAQIGDTICFDMLLTPFGGDADTLNNAKTWCFPVVNGYDPNDVQVYPQGACGEDYVESDQMLTYTVRFQNTGNAEAVHIRVLDSISPFLDINSLRVTASSFPVLTEILPGNVISFYFDSIMLPDSTNNEPLSHGYVIFQLDPVATIADGSVATNQADIYFDFNPPVITNEVTNTYYEILPCLLSTEELTQNDVLVYPVPATNELFVKSDVPVKGLVIRDLSGHELLTVSGNKAEVAALPSGIYLVEVITETGVVAKRFVK